MQKENRSIYNDSGSQLTHNPTTPVIFSSISYIPYILFLQSFLPDFCTRSVFQTLCLQLDVSDLLHQPFNSRKRDRLGHRIRSSNNITHQLDLLFYGLHSNRARVLNTRLPWAQRMESAWPLPTVGRSVVLHRFSFFSNSADVLVAERKQGSNDGLTETLQLIGSTDGTTPSPYSTWKFLSGKICNKGYTLDMCVGIGSDVQILLPSRPLMVSNRSIHCALVKIVHKILNKQRNQLLNSGSLLLDGTATASWTFVHTQHTKTVQHSNVSTKGEM